MCYHTHSSPNESIDFAVLRCTQSIDSFGKNGDIFSICTIYIFQTFFGTFPMTFLQKFSNQKVQFSIEINNIPKKLFEKSVRNMSIHLKLLPSMQVPEFLRVFFRESTQFLNPIRVLYNWKLILQRYKLHTRSSHRVEQKCNFEFLILLVYIFTYNDKQWPKIAF